MKKFVAYGLIAVLVVSLFTAFVIEPVDVLIADGLYTFAGLGMFVFGIWAAYLLLKNK